MFGASINVQNKYFLRCRHFDKDLAFGISAAP